MRYSPLRLLTSAFNLSRCSLSFFEPETNIDMDDICEKIEYLAENRDALMKMGEACRKMASVDAADRIYEEIKSDNA